MKNILIVSNSFLKGGLEYRIISQIEQFKKHKINAFLACEDFDKSNSPYFKGILHLNSLQSLNSASPSVEQIIKNRDLLINYCKKNKIDLIDCQPFHCILPAVLCAQKTHIPISFTLHGTISGDFINNNYPETKILFYIAMKYGVDQFFAVAEYLENLYSFLSPHILIARNGTSFKKRCSSYQPHNTGKFAIASRLDHAKTKIITDFLPLIHDLKTINSIDIYGEGDRKDFLSFFIQQSKLSKVSLKGWSNNLTQDIQNNGYDAVFGMGKVVLDALNANLPIGVLGYGGFAGFITPDNINDFAKTNLTSWNQISTPEIKTAIINVQNHPQKYILNKNNLSIFDDEQNWHQYLRSIRSLHPKNHPIIQKLNLILEESHKTSQQLQIHELIQKIDPLLQINNDIPYKTFYANSLHLNTLKTKISELEKTIAADNVIIAKNDAAILQKEIIIKSQKDSLSSITNSGFWKITEPIRKTLSTIHRKQKTSAHANPEIIAVLCTYNESLNIDGCLNHLEKYVDKIVLFDDGSTDETVDLAQKHKKVVQIIKNPHKTFWNERKNREIALKEAYLISDSKNPWALCIDADERLEQSFLNDLRNIIKKYINKKVALALHFRELWDGPSQYRTDGIWGQKRKAILFELSDKMTFNYSQEHHIPWYYQELNNKEILLEYNIYHLKMIKQNDREKRAALYNQLDPDKKMQPIGYDYLIDTTGIELKKIDQDHTFDLSTIPNYYK